MVAAVEVGTLIAVILKAKNLPNKRHIGKQDPYCSVRHNGEVRRTKAIKRGGQHPEWDEEVRFTIYEEVDEDKSLGGEGEVPPPPPPKGDSGKQIKKNKDKKIKGGMKMQVSCYADDPREPDLIGETFVDLTEVLTKGETDEWFALTNKDKYCGEVYLELTFWSNEKPPESKPTHQASTFHPQYGGPGSFTPTTSTSTEIPPSLKHGGANQTPSPGRVSPNGGIAVPLGAAVPASLRPQGSLASINLYQAPYERKGRYSDVGVDQLAGMVGEMNVGGSMGAGGAGRRESFPPAPGMSEFGYATPGSTMTGTYSTLSSSGSISSLHSGVHPTGRLPSHHRNSLSSLPESYSPNDGYSTLNGDPGAGHYPEPTSTGFVQPPMQSHTPSPYGYNPSPTPSISHHGHPRPRYSLPNPGNDPYVVPELDAMPGYAPVEMPSNEYGGYKDHSGYPPSGTFSPYPPPLGFSQPPPAPSHTPVPSHYNMTSPGPPPPQQSMSSGFVAPQPPPSSMSFHQPPQPQQPYPPPSQTPMPMPSRAYSQPPQAYPPHDATPLPPPSVPPPSHSAPPQQQQQYSHQTPSPPHMNQSVSSLPPPPQTSTYPGMQPNAPPPGSRPLPIPGQQQQQQQTQNGQSSGLAPPGGSAFPNAMPFQPPGPPPPPPPRRGNSLPPTPTKTGSVPPPGQMNYPPLPPPPLSNGNQQHSYLPNPPPPPPPLSSSQYQGGHNGGNILPPPSHTPTPQSSYGPPQPSHTPTPQSYNSQPHTPNNAHLYGNPSTQTPPHSQWATPPPPPPLPSSSSFGNSPHAQVPQHTSYGGNPQQPQDYYYNAPPQQQQQQWNTQPPPPPQQYHAQYSSWNS